MHVSVLRQYFPIIGLVLASVVSVFVTAATDNVITSTELGNLVLALLGAVLLYVVPRLHGGLGFWLKTIITLLTAAMQAWLSFLSNGITMAEWGQILLTAFAAVGVAATTKFVPVTRPTQAPAVTGPIVPDANL